MIVMTVTATAHRREAFSSRSRWHELDALPPIVVLWGDRDAIIPIAHGKALLQAVEGASLVELAGCGHHLHHDDPQAFLQAVHGALDVAFWPSMRLRAGPSASAAATRMGPRFRAALAELIRRKPHRGAGATLRGQSG
jgi:hypothetical protein